MAIKLQLIKSDATGFYSYPWNIKNKPWKNRYSFRGLRWWGIGFAICGRALVLTFIERE